jgi:DhnA family fructose-bisphosphate aldolase class Ia
MKGSEIRAGRLFDAQSRRAYVVAIDHGMLFGVQPGGENATAAVERCVATQPDGVFIAPGTLARTGNLFAHRGAPSAIARLDYVTIADQIKHYGDHHRLLCTPGEAVALGADAVCMYFVFGADSGETYADNLSAIGRAIAEAHALGIPLIAEVVAWGADAKDKRDPEVLSYGARLAAEVGADIIKTEYTGDPETMAALVAGVPVPVLVLGGARLDSEDELLETTRDALSSGVAGVIYGRNIWQADDPQRIGAAIRSLVHEPAPARV